MPGYCVLAVWQPEQNTTAAVMKIDAFEDLKREHDRLKALLQQELEDVNAEALDGKFAFDLQSNGFGFDDIGGGASSSESDDVKADGVEHADAPKHDLATHLEDELQQLVAEVGQAKKKIAVREEELKKRESMLMQKEKDLVAKETKLKVAAAHDDMDLGIKNDLKAGDSAPRFADTPRGVADTPRGARETPRGPRDALITPRGSRDPIYTPRDGRDTPRGVRDTPRAPRDTPRGARETPRGSREIDAKGLQSQSGRAPTHVRFGDSLFVVGSAQHQLEEVKLVVGSLQHQLEEAQQEDASLRRKLEEQQQIREASEKSLMTLRQTMTANATRMAREKKELDMKLREGNLQWEDWRQEQALAARQELQSLNERFRKSEGKLRDSLAAAEAKYRKSQTEVHRLEQDIEECYRQIGQRQQHIQRHTKELKHQLGNTEERGQTAQATVERLASEAEANCARIAELETELAASTRQLGETESLVQQKNLELGERDVDIDELAARMRETAMQFNEKAVECDDLLEHIQRLEERVISEREQREVAERSLATTRQDAEAGSSRHARDRKELEKELRDGKAQWKAWRQEQAEAQRKQLEDIADRWRKSEAKIKGELAEAEKKAQQRDAEVLRFEQYKTSQQELHAEAKEANEELQARMLVEIQGRRASEISRQELERRLGELELHALP